MVMLTAALVAAGAVAGGGAHAGRPQPMQSLLENVRAIPGAFVGWTPQVSFVNNPDGTIGFCFQCTPLASDWRGEYCMTTNSSGREWSAAQQLHSAPQPPTGTKYSAPAMLQWNGKQGTAAAAATLYQFLPLGIYSGGRAAWNGTSFVWETQPAGEVRQIWSGLNGGGIHGMILLTRGQYAGRVLSGWQWDQHGILYMYSDDGGKHWKNSTNLAVVPGDFYGGVEPSSIELSNGTVLTFIRTMRTPDQATLWQAYSTDGGASFAGSPYPTNLISFQSPVLVLRVSGSDTFSTAANPAGGLQPPIAKRDSPPPIVLVFNNARPTVSSVSGETYRSILHAAISLDDGLTWRGFREVMRDNAMRGSSDDSSDHGTAYPEGAAAVDGSIVFQSGQGAQHWSAMRFRPEWLLETTQSADWTTSEAALTWNNVSNFDGIYSSGCTAGTPSADPLGDARIVACATCTGAQFDPQMHRQVFIQPDASSLSIKLFAANVLPKCGDVTCSSPTGTRIQFNPCTIAHAHEDSVSTFERFQLDNWGNRSAYTRWSTNPTNWFNCSQLNARNIRASCNDHDGVTVRQPRLTVTGRSDARTAAPLALCAAMDAHARSAGFTWNFPSSRRGVLRLRVLLEREDFRGATVALSDHWEPPWHDRHDPTVAIFVLDIPSTGVGSISPGSAFDLTLTWDVDTMKALWNTGMAEGGADANDGVMNVTRANSMTIGAGGVNYVTIKSIGPGGICIATAHKADAADRMPGR
eukprot:COSAG02_NODE_46_length_45443_cov_36.731497_26_plen_749_part_00